MKLTRAENVINNIKTHADLIKLIKFFKFFIKILNFTIKQPTLNRFILKHKIKYLIKQNKNTSKRAKESTSKTRKI